MRKEVPVVLISSNAWVAAAAVTLQSVLDHYKGEDPLKVYIFTSDITKENAKKFVSYSSENVSVEIVQTDISMFEQFRVEGHYVPPLAFVKVQLAELLPQYDRIIYLDIDLIIKKDISPLMSVDLEGYFMAGVADMAAMVTLQWHKRLKKIRYVNTGVLILNAKKMREEDFCQKCIDVKLAHPEYQCQEQDPMNDVSDDEVKFLSVTWNLMSYNLVLNPNTNYSMNQINIFYETDYGTFQELEDDAAVIHLTNEFKPWVYEDCYMSEEWLSIYKRSKFCDCPLNLKKKPVESTVTGGGTEEERTIHIIARRGPFVKDWTETYTVLRLFGIPLVEKIKEGWRTRFRLLGIPFIKREWTPYEEKTYLFGICFRTRPHWPAIKQRADELFGRLGPIVDLIAPTAYNPEPYAGWLAQIEQLAALDSHRQKQQER